MDDDCVAVVADEVADLGVHMAAGKRADQLVDLVVVGSIQICMFNIAIRVRDLFIVEAVSMGAGCDDRIFDMNKLPCQCDNSQVTLSTVRRRSRKLPAKR